MGRYIGRLLERRASSSILSRSEGAGVARTSPLVYVLNLSCAFCARIRSRGLAPLRVWCAAALDRVGCVADVSGAPCALATRRDILYPRAADALHQGWLHVACGWRMWG